MKLMRMSNLAKHGHNLASRSSGLLTFRPISMVNAMERMTEIMICVPKGPKPC